MRIAYIAGYQSPGFLTQRRVVANRTLAGSTKIALVAKILATGGHEVVLLSHGVTGRRGFRIHKPMEESLPQCPSVRVNYATGTDIPALNIAVARRSLLRLLWHEHTKRPFDIVVVYNLSIPEASCCLHAQTVMQIGRAHA
jgi:hypothetical protein